MPLTVTIVGPREVIDEISRSNDIPDIEMDEPQAERGLADAVDSPIAPDDVQEFFQLLTVAIGTTTSAVILLQKIKDLLKKSSRHHRVRIKQPRTNLTLGEIDADTDVGKLAESIDRELLSG